MHALFIHIYVEITSGMILQKFYKPFSLEGKEISLEQLLEARENRAILQQECLAKYGQTILSLTLLAVGGVKKNELLDYVFAKALENLTACFKRLNVQPTAEFIRPLETGHEALFVLPIEAEILKKAAMELEDSSPLARLWDIDVIDQHGKLLSRTEFDFPPRPCLVCADNAKSCARSRKHSFDEIYAEMQQRVQAVYFAENIANLVHQALLQEVYLSPKPGLVDSRNNGSHRDMNVQTFERSAVVLRPFFADFVLKGMATRHLPETQILSQIRPLGIEAEKAMLSATQKVNTHKGAIFAFGLVCAAIGRLYRTPQTNIEAICQLVAQFAQGLTAELQNYPAHLPETAGVRLFRQYGLTGARGEAEQGFPLVRQILQKLKLYQEYGIEHQLQISLLHFMEKNTDTNVVHRAGIEGLNFVQQEANKRLKNAKILQDQTALIESLIELDEACIERNISCGGTADLIALTIFFLSL